MPLRDVEAFVTWHKTYRARGIPAANTRRSTKHLLLSLLHLDESSWLQIHSLAFNPYETRQSASKVATFTFSGVSSRLEGEKNKWTFILHQDEDDGDGDGDNLPRIKITIDCHFEGLTPMNSFDSDEEHKIDCISIPGLGGHAIGSFKERGGSHVWFRDSLPYDINRDFKGVCILTYGYDSHLFSSNSFQDLEAIASSFMTALRLTRRWYKYTNQTPRPLIFIAHSLGGLVLKQALYQMKNGTSVDKDNLKATYGALFFGVPNQGMDISSLIPMVEGQANLPFLMTLGPESTVLRRLNRDFDACFDFPDSSIISFFETEKSPSAKLGENGKWTMSGEPVILVSSTSAIQATPRQDQAHHVHPINRNHSDLVKYGADDELYKHVLDELIQLVIVAVDRIRSRFLEEPGNYSIRRTPTDDFILSRTESLSINEPSTPSRNTLNTNGRPSLDNEVYQILQPLDVEEEIDQLKYDTCPGTGEWVLEDSAFLDWAAKRGTATLLISGSPGSGKTFMVSKILAHLRERFFAPASDSMSVFFCDSKIEGLSKRSSLAVLKTLTAQLLERLEEIGKKTVKMDLENTIKSPRKTQNTFRQFHNILGRALQNFETNYIVLDALDECDDWIDLLEFLERLVQAPGVRIKFVISSRITKGIPEVVSRIPYPDCYNLSTSGQATQKDVEEFVRRGMRNLDVRDLGGEKAARALLVEGSQGLFLLASLRVNKLKAEVLFRHADVRAAMEELPEGIHMYYRKALNRLHGHDRQLARTIFLWLMFAQRPLSVLELIETTAVVPGDARLKKEEKATRRGLEHLGDGLIVVAGERVHLAHATVKEFAVSYFWDEAADGSSLKSLNINPHKEIVGICITYLSMPPFSVFADSELLANEWVLYRYTSRYWLRHLVSSQPTDQSVVDDVFEFFTSRAGLAWWSFLAVDLDYYDWWTISSMSSQVASWLYKADLAGLTWPSGYDFVADLSERHVAALKSEGVNEKLPRYVAALSLLSEQKIKVGKLREGEMLLASIATQMLQESESSEFLIAVLDLCRAQQQQGLFDHAESRINQVLSSCEITRGANHIDTIMALQCLGDLKRDQRLFKESIDILEDALSRANDSLGEEDPSILSVRISLGFTHTELGDYSTAEQLMDLQSFRAILGEEHHGTVRCMENLACLYRFSGQTKQAVALQEKVWSTRMITQGPKAVETMYSLSDLASAYRGHGNLVHAKELQAQLNESVSEVLGPDHPLLWRFRGEVGITKVMENKYDEGAALQQQVVDEMKSRLGSDHIWTLFSMEQLAHTKRLQEKFDEAELLQSQVRDGFQHLGSDHIDSIRILDAIALTKLESGKLEEALRMQEQTLELKKIIYRKDSPALLASMAAIARSKRQQGMFKVAEGLYMAVLEARRKSTGEDSPITLVAMADLAGVYYDQGRFYEAKDLYELILSKREAQLGRDHIYTLVSIASLASTFREVGMFEKAEEMQQRLLQSKQGMFGPEHEDTLNAMGGLAKIYEAQGRFQDAEDQRTRVLSLRQKKLGDEHHDVLNDMLELASTYRKLGKVDKAEDIQKQVVDVRMRLLGPDDVKTLNAIDHLALTYASQLQYYKARDLQRQVLEAREKQLGVEHSDLLVSMTNLSITHRSLGRLAVAEEIQQKVLEIRLRLLGTDHLDTANAKAHLAVTYTEQGHYQKAENLELEVLQLRQKLLDSSHPRVLDAMESLAETYALRSKLSEAKELQNTLLQYKKISVGDNHLQTARTMAYLAWTYNAMDQESIALELQEKVLAIREDQLPPNHPDILTAMIALAAGYDDQDRIDEARQLYQRVLDVRTEQLGPDHIDTIRAMYAIGSSWNALPLPEAQETLEKVLDWQNKNLEPENLWKLSTLFSLGLNSMAQKRLAESEKLLSYVWKTREEILGVEQLDTVMAKEYLSLSYNLQGKTELGRPLLEAVLEVRERLNGRDHQLTVGVRDLLSRPEQVERSNMYMRKGSQSSL